jgi:signal transduction histidine kinase
VVSVRDDGLGFAPARLAEARAEGRLGVASSIEGRVRDLGGTMAVESAPGTGTEIELRVPVDGEA